MATFQIYWFVSSPQIHLKTAKAIFLRAACPPFLTNSDKATKTGEIVAIIKLFKECTTLCSTTYNGSIAYQLLIYNVTKT